MAIVHIIYAYAYVSVLSKEVLLSEHLWLEKFCFH